jgi:hypothetical protein
MRFGTWDVMERSLFGETPEEEMGERNVSLPLAPFNIVIVIIIVAIAISFAARAQAQEISASLNETKPAEVRIVSTEFKYAPAKVRVTAGRAVTLVLDNSGAETEHGLFLPALGFRLEAKAGQIVRKSTVFVTPVNMNSFAICQVTRKRA